MKNRLHVCAFMLFSMLVFVPSHASVGNQYAEHLVKSLLPTIYDYLPLLKDETESAKLNKVLNDGGNSVQIFNASRTSDNKSYVLIYGHVVPGGSNLSTMLFVADNEEEFNKISSNVIEDAKTVTKTAGFRMLKLERVKKSSDRADYYRVVNTDGKNIGNYLFVSRGKNILVVSISGSEGFEEEKAIDKFLSGKIEKALSFKPDKNSPNFSP